MEVSTSVALKGPTTAQIEAELAAVREQIATLEAEAGDLSYPAVAGDQEAIASLATIRAQIQQAETDRAVLEDAKKIAIWREARAAEAKEGQYRAHHLRIAKDRAAELVRLGSRADDLVAELKKIFASLGTTEREIWNALREASAPPDDAIVGRKAIGQFAIASLTAFTRGEDRFGRVRPVADVAKSAWAHLLINEGATDV